jgi:carboxyl-terminal processing protease
MKIGKSVLVVISLFWVALSWATVTEVPLDQLKPSREHRQSTLIISKVINSYHYKRHTLDNAFSEVILDRYLESLDPNKRYFTQQDIDSFAKYRDRMDDALRWASLDPAFKIFRRYRQRVEERINHALKLVEQDFDFTRDEKYRFDREEVPWANGTAELEELWRKRVKNDVLSLRLTDKKPEEIRKTLRRRYQGTLRRAKQMDADDVFQIFINSYTFSIEPHTSYMSPKLAENFDISMRLSLEGIGAELTMENEYTEVQRTIPGGPAAQSGEIRSGDRITGVAQGRDGEMEDVVGWRLQDVVTLIRGPKGTVVRLQVLSKNAGVNGPGKEVVLVRNKIKLEDRAAQKIIIENLDGMAPLRIGVIEIPTFYRDFQGYSRGDENFRSTTRDVRRLLRELKAENVDGIVIDLRQNGGGSLIESTELTGLFIPSGPVVQVKNSSGEVDIETDPDPELVYDGPMAVLVNRFSASASEIFAGAIQDYGRGIIIGEPTFGKGTVQSLIDLDRFVRDSESKLGRLRLTMAQFFRVNGGSTQFKGVVPDIIFPTAEASGEDGERSLENALPWARISAATYDSEKLASLQRQREAHQRRIQSDPGFKFLLEEENLLRELRDQQLLSLKEEKRRAEWQQREDSRKERENRFRRFAGLPPLSEEESEDKDTSEEETEAIKRIGLHEAARILADYIVERTPRSAMVQ